MNNHEFTPIHTNPERTAFKGEERSFRNGVGNTVAVGRFEKLNGNALRFLNWSPLVSIRGY